MKTSCATHCLQYSEDLGPEGEGEGTERTDTEAQKERQRETKRIRP